uniref:Xanthan lyase n=1 Tax=Prevotella sp. GTC17253 TaxID=3236793 RepID=A0AB33ILS5_9BACT
MKKQLLVIQAVMDEKKLSMSLLLAAMSLHLVAQDVFAPKVSKPLVTELTALQTPTQGLTGRHIAMWQSHGRYYENKLDRWEWQRARLMMTVEDLYTQSYVLPFLVPMLENSGANVLLPRERDCNTEEVVVDNDGTFGHSSSRYVERVGAEVWTTGAGKGFAQTQGVYTDMQNPFLAGTFRCTPSVKKGNESTVRWIPAMENGGSYAVYVSYRSLPESTSSAIYTVRHKGGVSRFSVNQQMGGGTWIYLGTFPFDKNSSDSQYVELTNATGAKGEVVTADAVKFGGGMGNVGRPDVSGYPRFTEAARYWLQWAGVPDSVYTPSKGANDYSDDYKCRGLWVNWLAGGSEVNPQEAGLNIPVDLAFAFHSDAGTTLNDSIIGTLGIYMTDCYDGVFANGASRLLCKELTDSIQNSILRDVRRLFEPRWTSRGSRDASYFEARVPRVPTMLLELLSHQNFADMRYGLDPRFRFAVSRAIYKGMLRFLSRQRGQKFEVQPLPVDNFAAHLNDRQEVELAWTPTLDSLEESARPDRYIVYRRIGEGEFDDGTVVKKPRYTTRIPSDVVCSFKVVAYNKGGRSFPSEVLAVGISSKSQGKKALIVNGFNRVSAPADFVAPGDGGSKLAGFLDDVDHGVPYLRDISYIGKMKNFDRTQPWLDDDSGGYGDSYGDQETKVIAGNTFDYPSLHGAAILKAGYSFESCSRSAFTKVADGFSFIDVILGKQCQSKIGRGGVKPLEFKTFDDCMQQVLVGYARQGVDIMVSGSYVGTDIWNNPLAQTRKEDQEFAMGVLKYKWRNSRAAVTGRVKGVRSPLELKIGEGNYWNQLNDKSYVVESPDGIEPADSTSFTVMRYPESNLSAAVAYGGKDYQTFVMGIPFESIMDAGLRESLMNAVIRFFEKE